MLALSLHNDHPELIASATTLVSIRNTQVFWTALTALTKPGTLWQRITHFPLPRRRIPSHTYLHHIESGMWWRVHTIRTTRVLHSSQGLQLCCNRLHNTWRCLCLSSADSHIFLSAIAIYRMPHSLHICLAVRFRHILQYSLRFVYIACRFICFAIIVFYRSEIYSPIFTLSSTMPSVLHILHWSVIGLRCLFLLIGIRIVALLALIPLVITGSQV